MKRALICYSCQIVDGLADQEYKDKMVELEEVDEGICVEGVASPGRSLEDHDSPDEDHDSPDATVSLASTRSSVTVR